MIFVSDVHGAIAPLARLLESGEPLVVLGDLVNLTDYRNGQGAVADVLGIEFAQESARARAGGDYREMRALWNKRAGDDAEDLRGRIGAALGAQYQELLTTLDGGFGYVIHGNVDRPRHLIESLPGGFSYVHGEVVEIEGLRVGLVGGGISTPMKVEGEVSDDEMTRLLDGLGHVDVLGTHVPPAMAPLRRDVITGREERGSGPILDYILEYQPKYHLFGDVHQAQAVQWRIGRTHCHNAGYFRATGRYLRLNGATFQTARVSRPSDH